jgi:hypothetical protein
MSVVGERHRADDGQAKACPTLGPDAVAVQALERLEQVLDAVGGHDRPAAGDCQPGLVALGNGRDVQPAAADVMADRVGDQVVDQGRQQDRCGYWVRSSTQTTVRSPAQRANREDGRWWRTKALG